MIHFDGANVSEYLKYDLLTFCKFIFGGPTGGPNGGLRSQVSGLGSRVSGLRSQVSGLGSRVSGLRSLMLVTIVSFFLSPIPITTVFPLETLHLINVSSTYTCG